MDKSNNSILYGLIGYPLSHSYSANFFNDKFNTEKIDAEYKLFPLPDINNLHELLNNNSNLAGLNVTIPHKRNVMQYLDSISPLAKRAGAVNVVKITYTYNGERVLTGYNSDIYGFATSLKPLLPSKPISALILGSGGAAQAIKVALEDMSIPYSVVSRSKETGDITYEELTDSIIRNNLLIINATPVGMGASAGLAPDIPYDAIGNSHICFDLIYNPAETEFLKRAANNGAKTSNGLKMLHLQALKAWDIWTNSDTIR
jgi:shikimate dehydrogenase